MPIEESTIGESTSSMGDNIEIFHHRKNESFFISRPLNAPVEKRQIITGVYLLSIVTFTMSSSTPPAFRASHLYDPSSLSVTFVRIKFVLCSSIIRVSFLYQNTFGFGKPFFIMQVRLTRSPSRMVWFAPNNWTSDGGTKKEMNIKIINNV